MKQKFPSFVKYFESSSKVEFNLKRATSFGKSNFMSFSGFMETLDTLKIQFSVDLIILHFSN